MHPQAAGLIRQYIVDLITHDCVTASDPTWTIAPIVWRHGPTADEAGVWVGLEASLPVVTESRGAPIIWTPGRVDLELCVSVTDAGVRVGVERCEHDGLVRATPDDGLDLPGLLWSLQEF